MSTDNVVFSIEVLAKVMPTGYYKPKALITITGQPDKTVHDIFFANGEARQFETDKQAVLMGSMRLATDYYRAWLTTGHRYLQVISVLLWRSGLTAASIPIVDSRWLSDMSSGILPGLEPE